MLVILLLVKYDSDGLTYRSRSGVPGLFLQPCSDSPYAVLRATFAGACRFGEVYTSAQLLSPVTDGDRTKLPASSPVSSSI